MFHKYEDVGKGDKVYDYDAILNCIYNILNTPKGSLAMRRNFGINIEKYLFEPFDLHIAHFIKAEVRRSLIINCPYLDEIKIEVNPDYYLETYNVDVEVTAKGIPTLITTSMKFEKK